MKRYLSIDGFWCAGAFAILAFVVVSVFLCGQKPSDPEYFAYIGRCLNNGRHLYVDVWDCKGPILYWISALGTGINLLWGYPVVFTVIWALDLVLLFTLARRVGRNPGLVTFLFAIFAFGCGVDRFLVIGRQEALAVLFILTALHLDRVCRWGGAISLLIGACGGIVFMIKPTFVAFGTFLLAHWLMDAVANRDWRSFGVRCGCAVAGGLSVLAICMSAYLPQHVGDFWNGALLWNLLERIGNYPGGHWLQNIWTKKEYLNNHGWTALVLLPFVVTAFVLALFRGRGGWPLCAWLAIETVLLLKIPDFFGYYAIVISLPIVLTLSSKLSRRVLTSVVLVTAIVFGWKTAPRISYHFANTRMRSAERDRIERLITDRSAPVAVCGGNKVASVMNELGLFSDQKYLYWESWVRRCGSRSAEEMQADFNRALADPRCRILIGLWPKGKGLMLKRGASAELLARFHLVYTARNLGLAVFCKREQGNH